MCVEAEKERKKDNKKMLTQTKKDRMKGREE